MRLRDNLYLDRLKIDPTRPDLQNAQAILLERAEALTPADKLMLELAIKNRLTHRQLAQLLSVPPGTICRRLRRLRNRLCDPLIVALLHPLCRLPADYRQVAIEHMLHRKTVTELAALHDMRRDQVRQMLEYVRGWHRGIVLAPRT